MKGKLSARTLALVVSAIKNLREVHGSTSREISSYITSEYSVPKSIVKRKMNTALKRGLVYGILKNSHGQYSLVPDTKAEYPEMTTQELDLLESCSRKRKFKRRRRRRIRRRRRRRGGGIER